MCHICVVVVQLLSRVQLFVTPWTAAHQASLSFYLLKFAQTHVHRVSEAIQPSHPLLPSSFVFNLIPASGSSLISRLFTISDGQNIVASVSASVLPMNIQGWFPLGFSGWSSCCPRDSQESPSAQRNLKTCVRWWEYKSEQNKYWACSPGTYNPY